MSNVQVTHRLVEKNGKTIRENNMQIKHGFAVNDRVRFFHDQWDQHILAYVAILTRDCDGEPLYVLVPDRNKVEKIRECERIISDNHESAENKQYAHFEKMTTTIFSGYTAQSLEPVDVPGELAVLSNEWTYKHIYGSQYTIKFDRVVDERFVNKYIQKNECPSDQIVAGTIYPGADAERNFLAKSIDNAQSIKD